MKVTVTDLEGEVADYRLVDRVAFANQDTFGLPPALTPGRDEKLVIINVNGFSSLSLEEDV